MRKLADAERIRSFMEAVGQTAGKDIRLYFTGGATAVLNGWRANTIDVDILMIPEDDQVFREIPRLKEAREINVELASPADFIPEVPGWRGRSPFIERRGLVSFYHYDLHAQALAKIERGHALDDADVEGDLVSEVDPLILLARVLRSAGSVRGARQLNGADRVRTG